MVPIARLGNRPKFLRDQAVSKDGKALSGAARTSSIKKCCEDSAVSKDGKPLSGAAKTSCVKKCQADASQALLRSFNLEMWS